MEKSNNFENSWKNKTVFQEQLKLNLKELDARHAPSHWRALLDFFEIIQKVFIPKTTKWPFNPIKFLDIGCGCGAVSKLIHEYYPEIKYTGMDYASEAIEIATKNWPFADFIEKDYRDLTKEEIDKYDVVHACSLHNVLQNGDEAIDFTLSLKPRLLILGKILTTHTESYYETYKAYNLITTYKFFHNYQKLRKKICKYGSYVEKQEGLDVYHYLLERKDV